MLARKYVIMLDYSMHTALLIAIGNKNTASEIDLYAQTWLIQIQRHNKCTQLGINAGKLLTLYV